MTFHWPFEFLDIASNLLKVYIIPLCYAVHKCLPKLYPSISPICFTLVQYGLTVNKTCPQLYSSLTCLLAFYQRSDFVVDQQNWVLKYEPLFTAFPGPHNEELVGTYACFHTLKVFLCSYCSHDYGRKVYKDQWHHINCWDEARKRSLSVPNMNFEKCGCREKSVMVGNEGKRVNSGCLKWADTLQTSCNWLQAPKARVGIQSHDWVLVKGGWAQPDKMSHMRKNPTFSPQWLLDRLAEESTGAPEETSCSA